MPALIKMYKSGKSIDVDQTQVTQMVSNGWTTTVPVSGLQEDFKVQVNQQQVISSKWYKIETSFRLVLSGTGAVTINSQNVLGVVSLFSTVTLAGDIELVKSYVAANDVAIQLIFPSTVTDVELIL